MKNYCIAGCRQYTPVILATQEAEIRSQRRQIIQENPSQKRAGKVTQGIGPEFNSPYHKKKKKLY
jgi:hypothetical protein